MQPLPNQIRSAAFFKGLSEAACTKLAVLCRPRTLSRRDILFHEASEGHAVYLLLKGDIQLVKTSLDGKETVIKTVRPGELFAEVVLFEKSNYPVTAMACTDSELLEIPRAGFLRLLDEPPFRNEFIGMLMARQRYLAARVQQISSMDTEARFAEFVRTRRTTEGVLRLDLPKKDIAAAIGATPETFSRLLRSLEDRGLVTRTGRSLLIHPAFSKLYDE